jgi:hypothetical protein
MALSPRVNPHANSISRPKRYQRVRNNPLPRCQTKLKLLRDGGQHQHHFHQCKILANAPPRPVAKWKIGTGRQTIL